jgi:hypothetical protein
MPEWLVLTAVKLLKFVIMGIVSLTTCCEERPAAAPDSSSGGGIPAGTGSHVMMRELGACDLPAVRERTGPGEPGGVIVTIISVTDAGDA